MGWNKLQSKIESVYFTFRRRDLFFFFSSRFSTFCCRRQNFKQTKGICYNIDTFFYFPKYRRHWSNWKNFTYTVSVHNHTLKQVTDTQQKIQHRIKCFRYVKQLTNARPWIWKRRKAVKTDAPKWHETYDMYMHLTNITKMDHASFFLFLPLFHKTSLQTTIRNLNLFYIYIINQ